MDRNNLTNRAYFFDGVDDHISIPHEESLNLSGDYTISAWVKSDGCSTPCGTYHSIIMKRDVSIGTDNDWPWALSISYVDGPKKEFRKVFSGRRTSSSLDYQVSESEIDLNRWHHVVVVVQDNVQSIYLDGHLEGTYSFVQAQAINNKPVQIGWSLRPGLEQFKGVIDDIRLYNRALSLHEVLALFEE